MLVNPGFGGQAMIPEMLNKTERARGLIDAMNPDCLLEVDGGVNAATARQCVSAGADVLVAGSSSFAGGPERYAANIAALRGDA